MALQTRPETLDAYIGHPDMKANIKTLLDAAKTRQLPATHALMYGPAGTGKTTIARIVANEMGANLKTGIGPAYRTVPDIIPLLMSIRQGDVLFIDEIHALPRLVEEVLYTAMEDGVIDVVFGDIMPYTMRVPIPAFTMLGATTRLGKMSQPLRDRFKAVLRLNYYTDTELAEIITQTGVVATPDGIAEIARRGRGTPRVVLNLLSRVSDYALANGLLIDAETASKALDAIGVDKVGLDSNDRRFLKVLANRFGGGPAGIDAISSVMNEERDTVEDVIEPFLLWKGMIERTPRGRVLTVTGYQHLGMAVPERKETVVM